MEKIIKCDIIVKKQVNKLRVLSSDGAKAAGRQNQWVALVTGLPAVFAKESAMEAEVCPHSGFLCLKRRLEDGEAINDQT